MLFKTVEGGGKSTCAPKKKKKVIKKLENSLEFSIIQISEDNELKSIMVKIF